MLWVFRSGRVTIPSLQARILKLNNSHQKFFSAFWGSGCRFSSVDLSLPGWNPCCTFQVSAKFVSSQVLHNQTAVLCICWVSSPYSLGWKPSSTCTLHNMHAVIRIFTQACILNISLKTDVNMVYAK